MCYDFQQTSAFKTTDLGNTWTHSNECGSLDGCNFGPIQMLTENEGYLAYHWVSAFPVTSILKTTNGGDTWEGYSNPYFNFGITDYGFLSTETGWVSTNIRNIFRTTNAGTTWDTLQNPLTLNEVIHNIEFFNLNISYGINSDHIYFTNDGWVTYSIVDSIVTNVDNQQSLPTQFILYQNYPNPFNPATVISYQLSVNSNVTLKVYDFLGREVAVLVDEYRQAGKYQINFTASELASGVYYYQLKTGNFIQTKKMIFLR